MKTTKNYTKGIKTLAFMLMVFAFAVVVPMIFTTPDNTAEAAVKVSAKNINNGKAASVYVGKEVKICRTNTNLKVTRWYVSAKSNKYVKTNVAKVRVSSTYSAKVKGLKAGTCYLRAKINGKYVSIKITVKASKSTKTYSDYDLYLMSHLINGEAGCSWCSDEEQRAVGSVVLNRMKSSAFPNSLYGVIYQSGQYACTWDGNFNVTPTARSVANAKYILTYGSTLPAGVVFQAQAIQGPVYKKIGVHYFCYMR